MFNLAVIISFISGAALAVGVVGLVAAFWPRPKRRSGVAADEGATRQKLREEARISAAAGEVDLTIHSVGIEQLLFDSVEQAKHR
ncbi:hypothetical protein [Sphingomonas crocodyli]|uniref:Uncharacterized protein n=1 Tax=Sphingomonas crocodyli TaxID=1979270 RepID=A0A437M0V5_9SPHN|nr:hypothetical protein [Sphingomonas crocodyli]RVT91288.1 hypothetical protein EOD43_17430 [Sphingomonas crocodyli]